MFQYLKGNRSQCLQQTKTAFLKKRLRFNTSKAIDHPTQTLQIIGFITVFACFNTSKAIDHAAEVLEEVAAEEPVEEVKVVNMFQYLKGNRSLDY